jgi:hypothetical protein
LNDVGVTTTERLDQGHLYPLPEHPETYISLPGIEHGLLASQCSSKGLIEQLAIRNLYRIFEKDEYNAGKAIKKISGKLKIYFCMYQF